MVESLPCGVLGDPKDAKAPDPRPNADEALADGEDTPLGDNALNGFDRLWGVSVPKRFPRAGGAPSFLSEPLVERDNLEVL